MFTKYIYANNNFDKQEHLHFVNPGVSGSLKDGALSLNCSLFGHQTKIAQDNQFISLSYKNPQPFYLCVALNTVEKNIANVPLLPPTCAHSACLFKNLNFK